MIPDPVRPPLIYHNLRTGSVVSLKRPAPIDRLQSAVAYAIHQSVNEDCSVGIAGTAFGVFASLNAQEDGNASFFLTAAAPLSDRHLPPDSVLYFGTVAIHLPTAPVAWRHLMRYYVSRVAGAPSLRSFNAPGPMPKVMPWLCGFFPEDADRLRKEELHTVSSLIRLSAMMLLQRCERAVEAAATAGSLPEMNPDRYPELQEWAD